MTDRPLTENEQAMRTALAGLGRSVLNSWEKKDAEITRLKSLLSRIASETDPRRWRECGPHRMAEIHLLAKAGEDSGA